MPKKITQNVNKDKIFNDLPNVNPGHSKWLTRWTNYQDSNLGEIIPVYWDEVLPNEKRKVTMGMISHTTTPIAPIFPSLYTEFRAFWVPIRLAADLLNGYKTRKSPWVKVFGEDNSSSNSNVIVPLANQILPDVAYNFSTCLASSSIYLSNRSVFNSLDLDIGSNPNAIGKFNFLNLAAYELIYQRHYRNENYEAATDSGLYRLLFDAYNPSKSYSGITFPNFEISNREKDYFTGMKPFTLKNTSPVRLSIGSSALVKADSLFQHDMGAAIKLAPSAGSLLGGTALGVQSDGAKIGTTSSASGTYTGDITKSNLYADLTTATGISIEELRLLIKTQELLEKDAIYGSLYAESLNAHFGCCPLDTTLQDPQELLKVTITSQMQAIFQTSTTSGESTILGTIGANSSTQTDPFVIVPEKKFEEHGILMVCAVHKLQNVYDTRYWKPKFNLKKARFDFYTPELNDLGYQPVTKDEMTTLSGLGVAGYNEAFAEYRYKFNKLHGNLARSFQYWAPGISNEYNSAAALYKEDVAIFDKALSVSSLTAPQFYDAFGFEEVNEKPMSLHSIPGMDGVI